jgi:hypothetical protein
MLSSKRNVDGIAGIIVVAITLVFLSQLQRVSTHLDVVFPRFVIICLLALSALLLIKSFTKPDMKQLFAIKRKALVIWAIVISVLWVALLKRLGLVLSSMAAISVMSWMLADQERNKASTVILSIVVAAIVVAAAYLVFSGFLEVPLPKGLLDRVL